MSDSHDPNLSRPASRGFLVPPSEHADLLPDALPDGRLDADLIPIVERLERLAGSMEVPAGLADRVFFASAAHLPEPMANPWQRSHAASRPGSGRLVRLSRLAMAAAIGLAFVGAMPLAQRLVQKSGSTMGPGASAGRSESDNGRSSGVMRTALMDSTFTIAEPLLATLIHQECCREQRVAPDGQPVAAWADLAAMSDSSVAPILQMRETNIDDLADEMDRIMASSRSM